MTKEKEELKQIPGFSQGVRVNSALRMIKLAAPICPNSAVVMERDQNGRLVAVAKGPDQQNCQLAGGEWWKDCASRGHDPYFRVLAWTTRKPVYETEDDGTVVMTNEKVILHKDRLPNIVQIPVAANIHNGKGVIDSMRKKGRIRLGDIGYAEVCQYRNCQKPIVETYKTKRYGNYCSFEHMALFVAREEGELLHYVEGQLQGPETQKIAKLRDRQLREVTAFVK